MEPSILQKMYLLKQGALQIHQRTTSEGPDQEPQETDYTVHDFFFYLHGCAAEAAILATQQRIAIT